MVEFSTLPQLLLCRILSNIPLSKRKIQLGIVNKAWHQALLLPQSHTAALPEQVGALPNKQPEALVQLHRPSFS